MRQLSFIWQNGRSGCLEEQDQMGNFSGRLRALFGADSVAARALDTPSDPRRTAPRLRLLTFAVGFAAAFGASLQAGASQYARLDYNLYIGDLFRHSAFIELYDDRPVTTANFLQYVNQGKYTASIMHRLLTGVALQGGGYYPQFMDDASLTPLPYYLNPNARVDLDGNLATPNPTIQNEFTNSPARTNVRGSLSMAQPPGNPSGASS